MKFVTEVCLLNFKSSWCITFPHLALSLIEGDSFVGHMNVNMMADSVTFVMFFMFLLMWL